MEVLEVNSSFMCKITQQNSLVVSERSYPLNYTIRANLTSRRDKKQFTTLMYDNKVVRSRQKPRVHVRLLQSYLRPSARRSL